MSETDLAAVPLTRPAPAPRPGPLDERLYDLAEGRFRHAMRADPIAATLAGIHTEDHRLAEGSRDAVEEEIAATHRHLAAVEALETAGLSPEATFERDLELHNTRRALFDLEVVRLWERRSTAVDGVGDALFLLIARDFAPLPERLDAIAGRLEDVPRFLAANRTRPRGPQVRLWQEIEIRSALEMSGLFDELVAAGDGVLGAAEQRRLAAAAGRASATVEEYIAWLRGSLASAVDDWPLGRERFDELVRLRAFDGLGSDDILEIGLEQLAENKRLRTETAREIDPTLDEATVIDRLKADGPPTFAAALDGYRDAMLRSRTHLIERGIVTVPPDERLVVVETPAYQRNLLPFAAYFEPAKFDPHAVGIYVVTPSVDDDPGAMREHNWSSISNTSIHEAYPGHHLQLSIAVRHRSLSRYAVDAPEFVEGWGMYSEQLMREHGFDDAPNFRLNMHTDAIWRACRIMLDIRMHRGEIGVDEATDFLVRETDFERPNARAEVLRYTYTPTYQLSYLLGKVMLLQLREDERRRLGSAFDLRRFHDALLEAGSLPISFHRRLLGARVPGPAGAG